MIYEHSLRNFLEALNKEVEKGSKATDRDLLEFQSTISTNLLSGPLIRHRILIRRLLITNPQLAQVAGPKAIAESGIGAQLAQVSSSIRDRIYVLNSDYSAKSGKDFIKLTNETLKSMDTISRPTQDLAEYGDFIDALYFLIYEGTGDGQRFGETLPPEVGDIRDLRTQIRHDVDHGDVSKVQAKRRRLGAVFARYGNVSSPEALSQENFPLVQARVLAAVERMLHEVQVPRLN